jgi:predicted phage tail protein
MLRTIRIYGRLAKFLKRRKFTADVASAAEAVRFLLANFPHLEPELSQGYYRVSVGDYDLCEQELQDPAGSQEIKFIPVIAGAGAVGRIIAGVALIGLTIATGGFGGALIGLFGTGTLAVGTLALSVGAALALGGVSQLLTPVPRVGALSIGSSAGSGSGNAKTGSNSETDPRTSFNFSGIQNTSYQGTPVPIVYGEVLVGSVVISAGIDTAQVP